MKLIKIILKALLLIIIVLERYRFYALYNYKSHILNISLDNDLSIIYLFMYDFTISIITLIGVFLFFQIASLGVIIDTIIKLIGIYKYNLKNFSEKYQENCENILLIVLIIIFVQILLIFNHYLLTRKKFKIVNEDQRRSPRNSKDSRNPSKRRREVSLF